PPMPRTSPKLIARPSPVPCSALVVKKGSNTRSRISGGTPGPVSSTVTTTCLPVTVEDTDRKSTRLNSSHVAISYAVFCLKKKKQLNEEDVESISDSSYYATAFR